jgi:23S rRNA (cytidine1920-2'-O)/16S rRNA (cytidine1409-2'-O)-methyltransferase
MSMNSFHARTARPKPKAAKAVAGPAAGRHGGQRIDALLVERGLAPSRAAARRLIEAGRVFADEAPVSKPALELPATVALRIAEDPNDLRNLYVSRGGIKLAGALTKSGVEVRGRVCLDVGQSTGGFTDCLLANGAAHVAGVDVGHGQLHPKLAVDNRVEALEGINARELQKSALAGRRFDLIVADVSFISLTLVLPQLPAFLAPSGDMLLLVKPQFEVGPQGIGKGGIVRDATLYGEVETKLRHCCAANHLRVIAWFDSPITGTDGNREFFLHAKHEND